ncbi:MAG: MASE1 domain-containing protein [Gemmataceae bacterium]
MLNVRWIGRVIGVGLAYYVAARFGLLLQLPGTNASPVWPPSGIGLAALLIFGINVWPGIWAAAFLANLLTLPENSSGLLAALGIASGNTAEQLFAALLIRHFIRGASPIERPKNVFEFLAIGGAACAVASINGATCLYLNGIIPHNLVGAVWSTWWLGDLAGILIVTPFLVSWRLDSTWNYSLRRTLEFLLILISTAATVELLFGGWVHTVLVLLPFLFVLPWLLWAALRFGPRETATAALVFSVISIGRTWWSLAALQGHAEDRTHYVPFLSPALTAHESLLMLQVFICVAMTTAIMLAAAVNERRLAEVQLKLADRRKDEFLATLAHELRNPLAPLSNMLEILKQAGGGGVLDHARTTMERQLQQLVRLVDDLLDVNRINRDKLELRKERVDLIKVIEQSAEACRSLSQESDVPVTLDLPRSRIEVDADPVRLTQVFNNLLHNACKYTPRGGSIRIVAEQQGRVVLVSMKDTGIGLAPEMLPRIFELFMQIEHSMERTHGGLGIGLSLVKRLVEMHHGTIEVRSEGPGRGTEFIVRLPTLESETTAPVSASGPTGASELSKRRILVVDDNVDAAVSLAELLNLAGHQTMTAHDGEAALDLAKRHHPEIVLLDIGLPKMNGFEVCRQIREQSWATKTAVVALTGWGQEEDRRKSQAVGFNAHLVKPVEFHALIALLATLVP